MKQFKARASMTGALMTETRGKSNREKLQDLQETITKKETRLNGLSEKAVKSRDKITADLVQHRNDLEALEKVKDVVQLSDTTKAAIVSIFWDKEHGIRKELVSKYLDKGNEAEDDSIVLAQRVNTWDTIAKNEEHYNNEWLTGTPDLVYPEMIVDIKTSWSAHSFPLIAEEIPNDGYYWQLQAYMALTGRKKACLTYCLVNTPEMLVQDEIYKYARNNGFIDCPGDVELEIRRAHFYDRLPDGLRIKNFYFDRNDDDIARLYKRIEECREFYQEICNLA